MDQIIRFDWAMKNLLRNKANFVVLEGLVSTILNQKIEIVELLESESNQEYGNDKFNRVDIKARDSKGEIIIIEVKTTRELHYLQRIVYRTSKAITEHIQLGYSYDKVQKVYSINILYFDIGSGSDYVYHGKTRFIGVNTKDELKLTKENCDGLNLCPTEDVFPEYYLVRVKTFDKPNAETHLEQWLDYLKNNNISENADAPGLKEAQERLRYMLMDENERRAYIRHLEDLTYQNDVLKRAHLDGLEIGLAKGHAKGQAEGLVEGRAQGLAEGRAEGLAEGRAEGLAEGRAEGLAEGRAEGLAEGRESKSIEIAKNMKSQGCLSSLISTYTGLTEEEIERL